MRTIQLFFKEFFQSWSFKNHRCAIVLVLFGIFFLAFFWLAIYMVDFKSIFGITSSRGFWWHAFRNRGPVEIMQWLVMSAVVITSSINSGFHGCRGERKERFFWLLVAITFSLMVIEDAGDPRHIQGRHLMQFFGLHRIIVEALFFGTMVFPILYGFLRYREVPFKIPETRLYLILGGGLYAFVACTSLFRGFQSFYTNIGTRISLRFFGGEIPGFYLMDFVFEESVELMAGIFFLAGVWMYKKILIDSNKQSI